MGMLGPRDKPSMSLKAAESRGMLKLVKHLLDSHKHVFAQGKSEESRANLKMEGDYLLAASKAACNFEDILQNSKARRRVSPETEKQLQYEYSRFVVLMHRVDERFTPKCHLGYHLCRELSYHGHPSYYHEYGSETQNGEVAKVARSCHRHNWSTAVFRKSQIKDIIAKRAGENKRRKLIRSLQ
jgi:hypothetical protein